MRGLVPPSWKVTALRPMTPPPYPLPPLRRLARTACLLPLGGLLLCGSAELAAQGPFAKWKERKRGDALSTNPAEPKAKPFQGFFGAKRAVPPRSEPLSPAPSAPAASMPTPPVPSSAPAAYRSETVSFTGALPAAPRANPAQRRIFVLADSQGLLPFGEELQRALAAQGHEVLMHAVKNGTPYFWQGKWPSPVLTRLYEPAASPEQFGRWQEVSMTPRSVAAYVESYDPDLFVFQAGTNFDEDLAANHPGVARMIAESLREASSRGAKVLWIGPPDARDDVKTPEFQERALQSLSAALIEISREQGFDSLFDSRPACPMPNDAVGDGEHPPNAAGREWGRAAATWIGSALAHWQEKGNLRPLGSVASTSPSTPSAPAPSAPAAPAGLLVASPIAPLIPPPPISHATPPPTAPTDPNAAAAPTAPAFPPGYGLGATDPPTTVPPGYPMPSATAPPVGNAPQDAFARRLRETPLDPATLLSLELELVAKSDLGEVRTLEYSDAFAVHRYRVRDAALTGARLEAFGVRPDPTSGDYFVQVLHWAVHNDGSGPRATRLANLPLGEISFATLCPLEKHPLAGPLSTMPRFDDLNDFGAPIFVAADLLEERRF